MGIFIHLKVSKAVTKTEWERAYQESLVLVKKLPFAERRKVKIHNIDTICLVLTEEHEERYGWHDEKTRIGWFTNGDYEFMKTAECYFLPRNLVDDSEENPDAGDAMICQLPGCLGLSWEDRKYWNSYELWGPKTQGEPYHMYILAVGCLIEARLGYKAYVHGDITRGQCRKAVELANQYLEKPIEMPDCCFADRLLNRISKMPISEKEKMSALEYFYLGTKDFEFGKCMRDTFSAEVIDAYWKERFSRYDVDMNGFHTLCNEYMSMGFDLEKLCGYVKFQTKEGKDQSKEFVTRVMDAKLHLKDKNCTDYLETNPEDEGLPGVWALFAQAVFAGARNRKVDGHIPIEEIRRALKNGMGSRCDVDEIIEAYLAKEAGENEIHPATEASSHENLEEAVDQDASEIFTQFMDRQIEAEAKVHEAYDIVDSEDLKFYKEGNSIHPTLAKWLGRNCCFLDSVLEETEYADLLAADPDTRSRWVAAYNKYYLIRDMDWEKIYADIENNKESFGRYYSLLRVKADRDGVYDICIALLINDDLYAYSKVLAEANK